jgi:DNA-binding GntR family transcriptional regulator
MKRLGRTHENLDHKVYNKLKSMIVERSLMPGEKIYQDKLATELGVSRTPLISALKMLEQEKLITAVPRRGFFVKVFTKEEMIDVFELREVLEGLIARKAVAKITKSQTRKLQSFFKGLEVSADASDVKRYADEDRRFHAFLMELGGTEILSGILKTYNVFTFSYQREHLEGLVREPKDTIHEHLAIIDAINKKDPDEAERLMRLHLRNSREQLIREIEADKERTNDG